MTQVRRLLGRRGALRYSGCLLRSLPEVVRRQSLGPADALMAMPLTLRAPTGDLRIHSGDFGVVREIFGSRCYDHADWISRSRRFLDLGANEGLFTLYALAANPANQVIAVEAQAPLCARLEAQLRRNQLSARATVIHGLAGGGNRQLEPEIANSAPLDMDQLLRRVGPMDFLKIDIEGSEFALFAGSTAWLSRIHYIAMELHFDCGDRDTLRHTLRQQGWILHSEKRHRDLGYWFLENPSFSG